MPNSFLQIVKKWWGVFSSIIGTVAAAAGVATFVIAFVFPDRFSDAVAALRGASDEITESVEKSGAGVEKAIDDLNDTAAGAKQEISDDPIKELQNFGFSPLKDEPTNIVYTALLSNRLDIARLVLKGKLPLSDEIFGRVKIPESFADELVGYRYWTLVPESICADAEAARKVSVVGGNTSLINAGAKIAGAGNWGAFGKYCSQGQAQLKVEAKAYLEELERASVESKLAQKYAEEVNMQCVEHYNSDHFREGFLKYVAGYVQYSIGAASDYNSPVDFELSGGLGKYVHPIRYVLNSPRFNLHWYDADIEDGNLRVVNGKPVFTGKNRHTGEDNSINSLVDQQISQYVKLYCKYVPSIEGPKTEWDPFDEARGKTFFYADEARAILAQ